MREIQVFQEVFKTWQQAADHFLNLLAAIPFEKCTQSGVCGGWSCQQIVAHLAGWQREALKRYRDFLAGDTRSQNYDIDAFNASSVSAMKLLGWSEVVDTFRFTRDDLAQAALALTPEQISHNPLYAEWLIGLGRDLIEHTQQIKNWLEAQN
jgi:uncharacterized protein (TIGR03083 family)